MPSLFRTTSALLLLGTILSPAQSAELKIVSWNAEANMYETIEKRANNFQTLDRDLKPDVLVLIEVTGTEELKRITNYLGWPQYHAVISDFDDIRDSAFTGLEVAVVSKIPIESVSEFDASPDGDVASVFGTYGSVTATEVELSTSGVPHVDPLAKTDRGTLRVDLANGITVFPVHLKANTNAACADLSAMMNSYKRMGMNVPTDILGFYQTGFPKAVADHQLNAVKRERVIAAISLLADKAVAEGRTVVIAGDFNTSFETGKAGSTFADCQLKEYTCEKVPFPASACQGDGYDDTLAILKAALVGTTAWTFLSENLDRTYKDEAFADKAIDHIAVPRAQASLFDVAVKGTDTYGSDHFPITTTFKAP